jgi:hypothetical protein
MADRLSGTVAPFIGVSSMAMLPRRSEHGNRPRRACHIRRRIDPRPLSMRGSSPVVSPRAAAPRVHYSRRAGRARTPLCRIGSRPPGRLDLDRRRTMTMRDFAHLRREGRAASAAPTVDRRFVSLARVEHRTDEEVPCMPLRAWDCRSWSPSVGTIIRALPRCWQPSSAPGSPFSSSHLSLTMPASWRLGRAHGLRTPSAARARRRVAGRIPCRHRVPGARIRTCGLLLRRRLGRPMRDTRGTESRWQPRSCKLVGVAGASRLPQAVPVSYLAWLARAGSRRMRKHGLSCVRCRG